MKKRRKDHEPRRLGWEEIYPQQERVATQVLNIFWSNENPRSKNRRSPIIILEPQSGKSGTKIEVIYRFIQDCVRRNLTFQVIVFCGLTQLELIAQTRRRITESVSYDGPDVIRTGAKLDEFARATNMHCYPAEYQREGILILHNNTRMRKLDLNVPVDRRLWIGDEIHLGNVSIGNIDLMLKAHGVRISEQIHTWDNKKTINHFVGVSATPSAHLIKSDNVSLNGETLFKCIYESPSPNYNGLSKMRANGRLQETEPLFIDKTGRQPSAFLLRVRAAFKKACEKEGPGYLVIRAVGKQNLRLMIYINSLGRHIECKPFDSHQKNISAINAQFAQRPTEPTIIIIRGSMRAGITIPQKHHIRGWVEPRSGASDAPTQSGAGRACGYGRDKDTYPIYCDVERIDEWIAAYGKLQQNDTDLLPPSGVQNYRVKSRAQRTHIEIKGIKEIIKSIGDRRAMEIAKERYVDPYTEKNRRITDPLFKYRTQISSTANNVFLDVAEMFLQGRHDSGSALGIHVDGPTTDEAAREYIKRHSGGSGGRRKYVNPKEVWGWVRRNRASYARLLKKHPGFTGKVIILNIVRSNDPTAENRDDLQKKTSATRK